MVEGRTENLVNLVKMSDPKEKIRKYQLIKFINAPEDDNALVNIDRVPCRWVRYSIEQGEIVAKFPPPPYTKQKLTLLEKLIKTEGTPLPSWPEYPIQLIGHADTYQTANDRLVTLKTVPFAYTSDSDTAPQEKASQIVDQLKKQSMKKIMEVPEIEDDDAVESDYTISQHDSDSSSRERISRHSCKKIREARGKSKTYIKKKKVSKSTSRNYNSLSSDKSQESTSSKRITSKKPQEPVLQSASVSEASSDSSTNRFQNKIVTDMNLREGAYSVQESGELELEIILDEQQGSSNHNINLLDSMQKHPINDDKTAEVHLLKSSSFEQCLAKVSDTLQKADKNYSKDTLLILSALKGLSIDIKENTNAVNNLCAAVQANSKTSVDTNSNPKALVLGTDFELPFKTLEEFRKFDNQLKDVKYRQHSAASLLFYIDRENHVTKSITNILKKFVGRKVCMHFTAVKQMGDKEVFKNTNFSKIMFEVVTNHHTDNQGQTITEKYFFHCLGQAIANSKDWDGARVERAKKERAKKEEKIRKEMADE